MPYSMFKYTRFKHTRLSAFKYTKLSNALNNIRSFNALSSSSMSNGLTSY